MTQYWIPKELWNIVKNYMLGTEYWKRKLSTNCFSSITSRSCRNLGIIKTGKLMGSYPNNYRIITYFYESVNMCNHENVTEQQDTHTYFSQKFYNNQGLRKDFYLSS